MSSFRTHLLIGAVGGLALITWTPVLMYSPLHEGPTTLALIAASAVLADWPDIDEPGSWISGHVRVAIRIFTSVLLIPVGILLAPTLAPQFPPLAVGAACGGLGLLLLGPLVGNAVLYSIRHSTGGHRRLTHSLVLGAALGFVTLILWQRAQPAWAILFACLVWGQLLHLIGDLVTVSGVMLLWPISKQRFGLPHALASYGEVLITCVAVLVGLFLLRWP